MMERRTFLVGSAMALPMMGANDKVNVAVVGVGGRGSAHVREYLGIPNAHIGALCDVNTAATERNEQVVVKSQGDKPKIYQDLRKLYEDKDIDAVSIATPNHWHALATIWACHAGKDVYVEKPGAHNIWEGRRMVEAAHKYNRIVQHGVQLRSSEALQEAVSLLRGGVIGKVYMARGLVYRWRPSIGKKPSEAPPDYLDYNLWQGPAQERPFSKNIVHYNWHWHWDYGSGDAGNQGIHEIDMCMWGLGVGLPEKIASMSGKFLFDDDKETPEIQTST